MEINLRLAESRWMRRRAEKGVVNESQDSPATRFRLSEPHDELFTHGGVIDVASTEGEGSCFTLKLPVGGQENRVILQVNAD